VDSGWGLVAHPDLPVPQIKHQSAMPDTAQMLGLNLKTMAFHQGTRHLDILSPDVVANGVGMFREHVPAPKQLDLVVLWPGVGLAYFQLHQHHGFVAITTVEFVALSV
jgi:hypothetical protein